MVLVFYILNNYRSILQTKLGNREGYEARRIGLEAMPLDRHIEGCHSACEPGVEIRPHTIAFIPIDGPLCLRGKKTPSWLVDSALACSPARVPGEHRDAPVDT